MTVLAFEEPPDRKPIIKWGRVDIIRDPAAPDPQLRREKEVQGLLGPNGLYFYKPGPLLRIWILLAALGSFLARSLKDLREMPP